MTMSFVAGLSGGPAYSPTTLWAPLCKSQNPGWYGLIPEKAQDPQVQLPQDSLPAAHSIQVPLRSVPLALPSTTGSLPKKNRLQDASSLCPHSQAPSDSGRHREASGRPGPAGLSCPTGRETSAVGISGDWGEENTAAKTCSGWVFRHP